MSKMNTSIFIEKTISKHSSKYTYTNTIYYKSSELVTITCPLHGNFQQRPANHLFGHGCPKCKGDKISKTKQSIYTTEVFVEKATACHGSKYDYKNTEYINSHSKVHIGCTQHGVFSQTATGHLSGYGCPACGIERTTIARTQALNGWSYTDWEIAGKNSATFDSFKLYVVRCTSATEEFIKIGKTYNSVHTRFTKGAVPYKWKVLRVIEGEARYICELEEELHRNLRKAGHKYEPEKMFSGSTECYKVKLVENTND